MNILHELSGSLGAPQKVGKACLSSMVTFHAASSASSRGSSVSPSRRSSALSAASNSSSGFTDSGSGQWDSYTTWQLQTDMFRGHGGGSGGLFGGNGGQGGSGRPGFGGGNNPFGNGPSAQQFLFVGLKPDHASSFMGAVWQMLSVWCMMQTFGFLLYGDYAGGDVFQDDCFDTVEM